MATIKENIEKILKEMAFVLRDVDEKEVEALLAEIAKAKTIVVCGAGRVGMAVRGFAMRLGHLDFKAYAVGDATVPSIGAVAAFQK